MIGYWNSEEDDALQYLPLRAQVIYLRGIRRYADTNGIAGMKRRISWKSLSEVAEVLPSRGSHHPVDVPTRKAIRCAIEQLEKAELIKQMPDSERFKGLVFKCLMAGKDKSVQMRRGQGGAKEGPWEEGPIENPDAMRFSEVGGAKEGPCENNTKVGDEGPASPSPSPFIPYRTPRAREGDEHQDKTSTFPSNFQDSDIPDRPAQWEKFFQRERGFPLHILMTAKTIPLFKRWCDEKLTCGLIREVMRIAEAKLGRVPDSPMYYQNFVTDLCLSYEREKENPAGATTSTPGRAQPQQQQKGRTHDHDRPRNRLEHCREITNYITKGLAEGGDSEEMGGGAFCEDDRDIPGSVVRILPRSKHS